MRYGRRRTVLRSPESRVWALCGCSRCNARKKLRLDHQSLQAAAQQQHCNAAQCNAAQPTDKAAAAPHNCTCCCFFDTGTNCSMRQTQRAKQLAGFAWDSCSSRLTNEHLPRLLLNESLSEC